MQSMNPTRERKTIRVATNLTEHEIQIIENEMRNNQIINRSVFFRLKLLGSSAIPIIRFPPANVELSDSLKSLHSNLNQLVRQCHISGIDDKLAKELMNVAIKLNESTAELRALLRGEIPFSAIRAMAYESLTEHDAKGLLFYKKRLEGKP